MLIVNENICQEISLRGGNHSGYLPGPKHVNRFECACFSYWVLVKTLVTLHAKIIDLISNLVMFVIFFLLFFFFFPFFFFFI